MHSIRPLRLLRPSLAFAMIASSAVSSRITRGAEQLNLFAWSEYVPQAVIDGFAKETGIKVNYETYASGEEMLSKLLIGGATYDLVQPPDYIAESMIKHRLLRPLDSGKLKNLKNIVPEFL